MLPHLKRLLTIPITLHSVVDPVPKIECFVYFYNFLAQDIGQPKSFYTTVCSPQNGTKYADHNNSSISWIFLLPICKEI
jgi:hypothetical protein